LVGARRVVGAGRALAPCAGARWPWCWCIEGGGGWGAACSPSRAPSALGCWGRLAWPRVPALPPGWGGAGAGQGRGW
jgi:hypothetical protein